VVISLLFLFFFFFFLFLFVVGVVDFGVEAASSGQQLERSELHFVAEGVVFGTEVAEVSALEGG
jgi:hypothetical protein